VYLFFEPDSLRPSESPIEPSISTLGADNIVKEKSQSRLFIFYGDGGGRQSMNNVSNHVAQTKYIKSNIAY